MARIRTVKPEFFPSMSEKGTSLGARVLFAGMLTEADDAGRMIDSPKSLAGAVFPYDDNITARKVDGWLKELERSDSVLRYEVNGRRFIAVINFSVHQKISHPTPSRLPAPPEDLATGSGERKEPLGSDLGSGSGITPQPPTTVGEREPDGGGRSPTALEALERITGEELRLAVQQGGVRSPDALRRSKDADVNQRFGKRADELVRADPSLTPGDLVGVLRNATLAGAYHSRRAAEAEEAAGF